MSETDVMGALIIWFVGALYVALIIGRWFRMVSDRVKQVIKGTTGIDN